MIDKSVFQRLNSIFPVLNNQLRASIIPKNDIVQLATEIENLGMLNQIYETIFIKIDNLLRHQTIPNFWELKKEKDEHRLNKNFYKFQMAVYNLHEDYKKYYSILKNLAIFKGSRNISKDIVKRPNDLSEFHRMFRCALLSQLPHNFNDLVYEFYGTSFKVFALTHADNDNSEFMEVPEVFKCVGCGNDTNQCQCQNLATAFTSTNKYLSSMGLLDKIAGYTLTTLIQERIDARVNETKGNFTVSNIESLEKWLNTIVLQWLTRIYNKGSLTIAEGDKKIEEAIKNFQTKLNFYLYEVYANTIIEQFFIIIIEFPESQATIDDLKVCLQKIDLRSHLVKSIKTALETRLLHPGVDTPDILTGYVAAIKTLKHLDKTGVLLQTVTEPVKEYLRSRNDTVRCVVTGLTEEGPSDLSEELARSEAVKAKENTNEKVELSNWESWSPDPIDADPVLAKETRVNRPSDIISMVVDIYGSKELFVNEYRNLLAERLLSQLDFNPEKEIRNLELLKLRFGETLLHSCEVMLKDITDSKRINTHIQSDTEFSEGKLFDMSALIVSSQFWPTFKKETMNLPEEIKSLFDKYTKSYESYKGNRTLNWTPLNGKVCIDIEIEGKTIEYQVTPAQATIIIHFQSQNEWELEKLSLKMNMPPSILRKRLVFWQSQGLVRESKDNYFVLNDKNKAQEMQTQSHDICEDEEAESAMESASDQREEELQVFWTYIEAMLTNLDSLPLERIHQMLKMFATQIEFSQEELKNILQRKVREHKLIYAGGVYHLPKA